jgi:hypothetical protein
MKNGCTVRLDIGPDVAGWGKQNQVKSFAFFSFVFSYLFFSFPGPKGWKKTVLQKK